MITENQSTEFSTSIEPSDWRFSAAIVGMIRYFEFNNIAYGLEGRKLLYNFNDVDITKDSIQEKYLPFVEHRFADIFDNKEKSTEEVFKRSWKGYSRFCQTSKYNSSPGEVCRLLGFYVDTNRKTKSLGFNFDKNAATFTDYMEFDYIPFAFSRGHESAFINSNFRVSDLITNNNRLDGYEDWKDILFDDVIKTDVEIITKKPSDDFYQSVFLRQNAIDSFNLVKSVKFFDYVLKSAFKNSAGDYINLKDEVVHCILNDLLLDDLIDQLLLIEGTKMQVELLIKANTLIYEK